MPISPKGRAPRKAICIPNTFVRIFNLFSVVLFLEGRHKNVRMYRRPFSNLHNAFFPPPPPLFSFPPRLSFLFFLFRYSERFRIFSVCNWRKHVDFSVGISNTGNFISLRSCVSHAFFYSIFPQVRKNHSPMIVINRDQQLSFNYVTLLSSYQNDMRVIKLYQARIYWITRYINIKDTVTSK